jgi:hypothetical protein
MMMDIHPHNLEFCLNGFSIEEVDFMPLCTFTSDKVDLIEQDFVINYKTDDTFLERVT